MALPQPAETISNVSPPYPAAARQCHRLARGLRVYFPDVEWTPIDPDEGPRCYCFDTIPDPATAVGLFLMLEPERGGWALTDVHGGPGDSEIAWAPTLAGAVTKALQAIPETWEMPCAYADLLDDAA